MAETPKKTTKKKPPTPQKKTPQPISFIIDGIGNTPEHNSGVGNSDEIDKLLQVIKEHWSTEDIELKTDLTERQVLAMSRARLFCNVFDIPEIETFIIDICKFYVSKDRGGRKEAVEIMRSLLGSSEPEKLPGLMDRLVGREVV